MPIKKALPQPTIDAYTGKDWRLPELIAKGFASRAKIYKLINAGDIDAYHLGNNTRVIGGSIDAFIERNRFQPKPDVA
jgi:hypothetical protein